LRQEKKFNDGGCVISGGIANKEFNYCTNRLYEAQSKLHMVLDYPVPEKNILVQWILLHLLQKQQSFMKQKVFSMLLKTIYLLQKAQTLYNHPICLR